MSNSTNAVPETEQCLYSGIQGEARKFAFASGEIVYNIPWMLVSSYLAFFMTDIALIPASAVSLLFLICRCWDAVNDPLIGFLADNTKTRLGRYRPWMLCGACGFIPLVALCFRAHPAWSVGARTAYGCGLYFIVVIFSTSWNIPYSALNSVISPYPRERASFSSHRIFVSSLACSASTAMFLPLVSRFSGEGGSDPVRGYAMAAVVVCAVTIPFVFTSVFGSREAIMAPPKQRFTRKQMLGTFTQNRPLLIICAAFFIYGFLNYGRMTAGMYYFTYVWENPGLFTVYATFNGIVCAAAAFFSAGLAKLFRGKKNAMLFSYGMAFVLNIALFFLTPANSSPSLVIALLYCAGVSNGFTTALLYGIIGDACDYGQWKTHLRADGLATSGTSFALKLGGALAPTTLLALLNATGYTANAAGQAPSALFAMNVVMNLIPAVLAVIGLLLFLFYNLDERKHAEIIAELKENNEFFVS